jgi:hypothetical protein
MTFARTLPALASFLAIASWGKAASACGMGALTFGPGALEVFVILLAVFGIGISASVALGRGSSKLRDMARRRPSRGLRVSAIAATAGFAATATFVTGLAVLFLLVLW